MNGRRGGEDLAVLIERSAGDAIILLNLLDDLEYRTYSNMGRAVFRSLPRGGFVHARLVPSGPATGYGWFRGRC